MQAQVIPIRGSEPVALIREGMALKESIKAAETRLKDGSKTGVVAGDGVRAKVALKEYEKWDQEKLAVARSKVGDERFFSLFKWEFSPRSKKDMDGFLAFASDFEKGFILDALTTKPGAPSVTYEEA